MEKACEPPSVWTAEPAAFSLSKHARTLGYILAPESQKGFPGHRQIFSGDIIFPSSRNTSKHICLDFLSHLIIFLLPPVSEVGVTKCPTCAMEERGGKGFKKKNLIHGVSDWKIVMGLASHRKGRAPT